MSLSFDTISGVGSNGAIIHYRSNFDHIVSNEHYLILSHNKGQVVVYA